MLILGKSPSRGIGRTVHKGYEGEAGASKSTV